jgi:hypothetical protein
MPRLVGKRSNSGVLWSFAVLVVAIAGFGTLEYKGYTDFVPEVGPQVRPTVGGSDRPNLLQPSGNDAAEPISPPPAAGDSAAPAPSQPAAEGTAEPNSL